MPGSRLSFDRRTLIKSGLVLGASQVMGAPFIVKSLADEPIKIGMVNPLTGILSALAQSEVDGARYAEAEINKKGGILGRPVQLLVEDSANDVGTGVQKTRKLIERDQVSFIIGDVNSGIAIAIAQVTSEKKILHIVSGGPPTTPNDVLMDAGTAQKYDFTVGQQVRILFAGPSRTFTITGIAQFGTANNLGMFPIIDEVEELHILADNDPKENGRVGQAKAKQCAGRYSAFAKRVETHTPTRHKDFNDILMEMRRG